YTADEVADQVVDALAWGFPTTCPIAETWTNMMDYADVDDGCPAMLGGLEVYDPMGCTTADGYTFQGAGGGWGSWQTVEDAEVYTFGLRVDGWIRDADQNTFAIGGQTSFVWTMNGDGISVDQELIGSYDYPAADDWLGAGLSSSFWMTATAPMGDDTS